MVATPRAVACLGVAWPTAVVMKLVKMIFLLLGWDGISLIFKVHGVSTQTRHNSRENSIKKKKSLLLAPTRRRDRCRMPPWFFFKRAVFHANWCPLLSWISIATSTVLRNDAQKYSTHLQVLRNKRRTSPFILKRGMCDIFCLFSLWCMKAIAPIT